MSDDDSLFGDSSDEKENLLLAPVIPASRINRKVSGLHYDPSFRIPPELALSLLQNIEKANYFANGANQVMLFGRTIITETGVSSTGLPSFIDDLILSLEDLCRLYVPSEVHENLFPKRNLSRSRQVIFNRYHPGEGITPHIDLLERYDDGIIGKQGMSLWLPENSVIILEGEARYQWTHGIRPLHGDVVEDEVSGVKWIPRGVRTSITLRWLLPGADVVGSEG